MPLVFGFSVYPPCETSFNADVSASRTWRYVAVANCYHGDVVVRSIVT